MKGILITGALGQLGSEIATELRRLHGPDRVVLTDVRDTINRDLVEEGPFYRSDVRDGAELSRIVKKHRIGTIYHLAALLSATAEDRPQEAWDLNLNGLLTVLEVAREQGAAVFTPSSIGAFGPTTPRDWTPQDTLQRPTSMYGVTKVAGELLCDYYHFKYGVDTRGLRYPGLISSKTPPGGGTTDYAVDIYYQALRTGRYRCFLKGDTYLDMMYMPDAVRAAISLMEADPSRLRHRNAFNVTAMSFCPEEQAAYIRACLPRFEIDYEVDPVRQAIANSWPNAMEDYAARVEWGWEPQYDLEATTRDMLRVLSQRLEDARYVWNDEG
ncbi:UDP-glucose 4-epimerase [Alkalispirochaeta sphaeroplastigenens]|uniref:UDP-glucose 4-epimerase n=1 Tax=Alkalispirochaeta sphaeroplastigenens TaxID=1187066 RepID=A0A2S4JPT8_9SPIO|nr:MULTISPECIES: NAD-dependent epimerase/dehydratase family protein [Alkalispirochaeta]POR01512.1 UDP-glucose 4-epimerase [Alkalispirochaeta sphaeroplastigenens]